MDLDGRYTAGEFSPQGHFDGRPYSPIELYVAGFIPSEKVPYLWVAEDGQFLRDEGGNYVLGNDGHRIFTASRVKEYTIEDIIAENGPRVPDYLQSQKDFRAAAILLIDEDHPGFEVAGEFKCRV